MSGPVANNVFRSSGVIASAAGGLNWQAVVTASTLTAEAGNGYLINTTSNTCTITLPASAEAGDKIIFVDYARTWGTYKIIIDSNGLNYQGEDDTYTVEYDTDGQTVSIVYSGATVGWIPEDDDAVEDEGNIPPTQKAIFYCGEANGAPGLQNVSNLVTSSGVVGTDVTGVGTARNYLAGASYGYDKGIFGYGIVSSTDQNVTNLVTSSGVIGADVSGVGTARAQLAATTYGGNKAIFAYGYGGSPGGYQGSNLVNSSGVVAADVTVVGTARQDPAATGYGTDLAIFAYGVVGASYKNMSNLVTNVGVIGTDVTGVGSVRSKLGAARYGGDKAIFVYGGIAYPSMLNVSNLVNNVGVVGADVTGVGTARNTLAAAEYGGDKAIFGYGTNSSGTQVSLTNLVNNSGVVAADVTGVGTARGGIAATGYSISA